MTKKNEFKCPECESTKVIYMPFHEACWCPECQEKLDPEKCRVTE